MVDGRSIDSRLQRYREVLLKAAGCARRLYGIKLRLIEGWFIFLPSPSRGWKSPLTQHFSGRRFCFTRKFSSVLTRLLARDGPKRHRGWRGWEVGAASAPTRIHPAHWRHLPLSVALRALTKVKSPRLTSRVSLCDRPPGLHAGIAATFVITARTIIALAICTSATKLLDRLARSPGQ